MIRCLTLVALASFAFRALAADGPQTAPAEPGAHPQPLHLADPVFLLPEGDASRGLSVRERQEQAALGRRVRPGQPGQLRVEVLEAKRDSERLLILDEKSACDLDLGR